MLTTIEAEIDVNGNVRLLEPIRIKKKSRAIVTLLDVETDSETAKLSDAERYQALQNLMQHAGAVQSGNPNSADNEQIDRDLAGEYGKDL